MGGRNNGGDTLNGGHLWVREGTWFPHTPHSGGVCCVFDFVENTTNPTVKLWHATACVFCRAQAAHKTGDTC